MKLTATAAMAVLAYTGFASASPTPDNLDARSDGMCSNTNDRCVGDITYYDGSLGACGW
jgi:hypothetical protein